MTERHSLRILCAEDNRLFGDTLNNLFSAAGHSVTYVENGFDAWDVLSHDLDRIDMVVTDHQMPGFTGLELVQLLRQTTYAGGIVVYTAVLTAAERENYTNLAVDGIVLKTVQLAELLSVVEGWRPRRA